MQNTEFLQDYSAAIRHEALGDFAGSPLPSSLLMQEQAGVSVYYAPFDYVNEAAKLVIIGITPGLAQSLAALRYAASALASGLDVRSVLEGAKSHASFSGPMRNNLTAMLDHVGLNHRLGLDSTSSLFGNHTGLVHFTSVLRYPAFAHGENYNGSPSPFRAAILKDNLSYFRSEVELLSNALFLPVGKLPNEVLRWLVHDGLVCEENVLFGLPHPSSANMERILYFLGKKPLTSLSRRTNPSPIDAARASIVGKLEKYELKK